MAVEGGGGRRRFRRGAWLALLLAAGLIGWQNEALQAFYWARFLHDADPAARMGACRRLVDLGEPGWSAISAWLGTGREAELETYRSAASMLRGKIPKMDRRERLAAARFFAVNAWRDAPYTPLNFDAHTGCPTSWGLEELGDEAVIAIGEELAALTVARVPSAGKGAARKAAASLTLPLMRLYPRGKDRIAPILEAFWRYAPKLRRDLGKNGGTIDLTSFEDTVEAAVYRYRGLDVERMRENEQGAEEVLYRLAPRLRWLLDPFGGGRSRVPGFAELEAALLREQVRRPCLHRELSQLRAPEGSGGEAGYAFECEPAGAGWRAIARPLEPGLSARYWYVMTHELELTVYEREPELDRASAALPGGAREVMRLVAPDVSFFGPHREGFSEPWPLAAEDAKPCRELVKAFGLDGIEALEMWHSERAAIEVLAAIGDAQEERRADGLGVATLGELVASGLELVPGHRGWHRGYRIECGQVGGSSGSRSWARARPIEPGQTGRYGFLLTAEGELWVYRDGSAELDRSTGLAARPGAWSLRDLRSAELSFEEVEDG